MPRDSVEQFRTLVAGATGEQEETQKVAAEER
jgi:hypothetical protein